jgi:hypothetical protein
MRTGRQLCRRIHSYPTLPHVLCYPEIWLRRACKPWTGYPSAWQGRRFALPLHPSRAGVSHPMHPCGEPSCSLRPMTEALPLRHHSGAFLPLKTQTKARRPWNLTRGYRAPRPLAGDFRVPAPTARACALWTTRRGLSCPCTLTGGIRPPRPAAGQNRLKGGVLD